MPKIEALSDSVPPLVKITSLGRALISLATCWRAFSTAFLARWPNQWMEEALPKSSSR